MRDVSRAVLASGDDDATIAYLFMSSGDPSLHAVSRDPQGRNLPSDESEMGWVCQREFALGVREPMPVHIAPEPVLRGLEALGYYLWRDDSNPKGTSQ